jgi:hypothetical protein
MWKDLNRRNPTWKRKLRQKKYMEADETLSKQETSIESQVV